jgi:hypothetical protein
VKVYLDVEFPYRTSRESVALAAVSTTDEVRKLCDAWETRYHRGAAWLNPVCVGLIDASRDVGAWHWWLLYFLPVAVGGTLTLRGEYDRLMPAPLGLVEYARRVGVVRKRLEPRHRFAHRVLLAEQRFRAVRVAQRHAGELQ